jgi:hypothetical protein
MQQVIQRIAQSLEERPRRIWAICLGLRTGCPSILAEGGYQETDRVTYGSARISIFTNHAGQTGPRSYSPVRDRLAIATRRSA